VELGDLRLAGVACDTHPVARGSGEAPVDALLVRGLVEEGEKSRPILNRFGAHEPDLAEEEQQREGEQEG
jgi:hypothetical protein